MTVIRLTDRQVVAAASERDLVNIVSAPGSGKTTVAAERFGYLRHGRLDRSRGVIALSFTRSAVGELRRRIAARWGRRSIEMPNLVTTFDDLHVRLLHYLLERGLIIWPGGHHQIDVLDSYQGCKGHRYLTAGNYRRLAMWLASGVVDSSAVAVTKPRWGIGGVADHRTVLSSGKASHEDVRSVLLSTLKSSASVRAEVKDWFTRNFEALVIDEIYDADVLDLSAAYLAAEAGLAVTLVGDPWQALYEWRGATPGKVATLLGSFPFGEYDQPESFRFEGDQMRELSTRLRNGSGVTVPTTVSASVDVAIARRWTQLWDVGDNVLPLAFRSVANATDAMLNLFLDEITRGALGRASFGKQAALVYLRLDPESAASNQADVLHPAIEALASGAPSSAVLDMLRSAATALGAPRRPSRLTAANEADREADLGRLRVRLGRKDLIPGLSVHQAKGCEWNRVGVVLMPKDDQILADGLRPLEPEHCVLYVALTRARRSCGSLRRTGELQPL